MSSHSITYNTTFSIMKGIAIISVVLGHCFVKTHIEMFVNQYHLAVFFFTSGYFLKEKHLSNWKRTITGKIRNLYLPYLIINIIFLCLHNWLASLYVYDNSYTLSEFIMGLYWTAIRLVPTELMMGAMWFCPTLLIVSLLSILLLKNNKTNNIWGGEICNCTIFIALALIGGTAYHYKLKNPYNIWQVFIVAFIYYEGYVFAKYEKGKTIFNRKWLWLFLCIAIFTSIIILNKFGFCAYLQSHHLAKQNILMTLLISSSGSIAILGLSTIINQVPAFSHILGYIGNHSFSIMALHFIAFKLVNYIQCIYYHYDISRITEFPYIHNSNLAWALTYLLAGICLPLLSAAIYNRLKNIII